MDRVRKEANAIIGRSRKAAISRPQAARILGATDQIAMAMMSRASSTQRNQAGPDGHGPTVMTRHQK